MRGSKRCLDGAWPNAPGCSCLRSDGTWKALGTRCFSLSRAENAQEYSWEQAVRNQQVPRPLSHPASCEIQILKLLRFVESPDGVALQILNPLTSRGDDLVARHPARLGVPSTSVDRSLMSHVRLRAIRADHRSFRYSVRLWDRFVPGFQLDYSRTVSPRHSTKFRNQVRD
jgi:hypothetical protein